jgi:hypothetical protein
MLASTLLDLSRSALPNLTPLIDQFGSTRDFGSSCLTKTPTKASQFDSAFTAAVIANSRLALESKTRSSNNREYGSQTIARHTAKNVYEISRLVRSHFPRKVDSCLTNLGVKVTA